LRKRLKHHLRQHPLPRAHDSLVLEQLVGDAVVGLLALDDDDVAGFPSSMTLKPMLRTSL
jgi:hypothetical protein